MPSRTTRAKANRRLQAQQEEHSNVKATRERSAAAEVNQPQEPSLGREFSQATFESHAALLSDSQLFHPANARVKAQVVRKLQSDYGNQYVQRLVNHITAKREVQSKRIQRPEDEAVQRHLADEEEGQLEQAADTAGWDEDKIFGELLLADNRLRVYTDEEIEGIYHKINLDMMKILDVKPYKEHFTE